MTIKPMLILFQIVVADHAGVIQVFSLKRNEIQVGITFMLPPDQFQVQGKSRLH